MHTANKVFQNQIIEVAKDSFTNCIFQECEFVGMGEGIFRKCKFAGTQKGFFPDKAKLMLKCMFSMKPYD